MTNNSWWVKIWRPGIVQKIAYGYALAIGIATLGATIGLIIGDYYQQQSQKKLLITRQQQAILNNLDKEILHVRSHPQRLMMAFGDPIWFDFERTAFLGHTDKAEASIQALNAFVKENPNFLAVAASDLQALAQGYATNIENYSLWIRSFWQQVNPGNLTPQEIPVVQQRLLSALRQEPMIGLELQFERLTEQLDQILVVAQRQQTLADAELAAAKNLRLQIILGMMAIAAAIAMTLAFYTSRAIARPIQAVTEVAQQVSRESDFSLQAPVLTQDEVGILAIAFNRLIQTVAEYTQALELSRQTLEERVEERTQELQEALKNIRQAQSQLIQAEKMSSLGQLVAGVAHEINNPVNFIHGNLVHADEYIQELLELLDLYRSHLQNHPLPIREKEEEIDLEFLRQDLPKLLNSMKVGADRIRDIVHSLRNFSRLDEATLKEVDIHEGLDSTLMILQNRLKAKPKHPEIRVIKQYGQLPLVECYAGQLNQVFMNVLTNAIDALDEYAGQRSPTDLAAHPGTITIRTAAIDDSQVVIRIADNGPGMTPEVQQRLFDPFFTTKPVGKGTGMGMSISYQIITEYHNGHIECRSEPGQGAEFIITIPTRQDKPSSQGT
ncbi:ATP-binding protein [Trichothermofontia sichuanensis B231]|uniref:sensor histidine kinase n=1 Tax=Trichothermofontia sichuanensis TaxID=3045816 RepID=UPI002245E4CC|nr:ATP-binding protein [Trichothermofontia sichuanensis]UZQ53312.1 ATP-binding protein [Trichothermofontia sichuanensis B231]